MKRQSVVWSMLSVMLLARGALAATGMPGLDTLFRTIDTGMGSAGYIFFIAALAVLLVAFMTGHTYMGLGMLGLLGIGGALIGHRTELGGMLNLALGADLDALSTQVQAAWPFLLDYLP